MSKQKISTCPGRNFIYTASDYQENELFIVLNKFIGIM